VGSLPFAENFEVVEMKPPAKLEVGERGVKDRTLSVTRGRNDMYEIDILWISSRVSDISNT
jgi:hypothetical protein